MLPYILEPLPDESFFSVLCRYHLLYGNGKTNETIRYLFGLKNANSPIPGYNIKQLLLKLGIHTLKDRNIFILNTTLFPLYSAWQINKNSENTIPSLYEIKKIKKIRINRYENRFIFNEVVEGIAKYCNKCIEEDLQKHGVAYWHRSHQVNEVICCHKHNQPLKKHDIYDHSYRCSLSLRLPHSDGEPLHQIDKTLEDIHIFNENRLQACRISKFIHELLNVTFDIKFSAISTSLREAIYNHGYTPLDLERGIFNKSFSSYINGINKFLPNHPIDIISFDTNIRKTLSGLKNRMSDCFTFTDLVLITFLFNSFDNFKKSLIKNEKILSLYYELLDKGYDKNDLKYFVFTKKYSCEKISQKTGLNPIDVWCLLNEKCIRPIECTNNIRKRTF